MQHDFFVLPRLLLTMLRAREIISPCHDCVCRPCILALPPYVPRTRDIYIHRQYYTCSPHLHSRTVPARLPSEPATFPHDPASLPTVHTPPLLFSVIFSEQWVPVRCTPLSLHQVSSHCVPVPLPAVSTYLPHPCGCVSIPPVPQMVRNATNVMKHNK